MRRYPKETQMSTDNNVRALQFTCDTDPSRRWTLRLKL
jgi:cytolethal distending toxin subunit A